MAKILIIENDLTMLEILKEVLELNSYSVKIASSGLEGVEIAKDFKPDLIICDLIIGDISGYEVFDRVSGYFLFLTGTTPSQWRRLERSSFLQKPISIETLILRIGRILNPIG